jgi:hypothetical protein
MTVGSHTLSVDSVRTEGQAAGWPTWRITLEIYKRLDVSLLRAQRLARGWTLQGAVAELRKSYVEIWGEEPRVSHQRLSRWGKGGDVPSIRYLECLCKIYRTRPDRLGFGADYTEDRDMAITVDLPQSGETAQLTEDVTVHGPGKRLIRPSAKEVVDVNRRTFLQTIAVYGGVAASAPLLEALAQVRDEADQLLNEQSTSDATVSRWEAAAEDYGYLWLTLPPFMFLAQAMPDFVAVKKILGSRQPLDLQKRLYRVMAQLAGLIASSVNAVSDSRETHAWFHTARLAAEETGDRTLRAWVTANEGMSYLWYNRPAERAVELAQTRFRE